ncbi:flavodoxin domain-containing protein [Kribbella speibonae]|uniref:Flavodoxin n=1 Tax=Kribbella speibonae TaxID=1572660 RepID=A0A4R0IE91_9ACTN|nr:flavodoxin domain-containing protein [Kribbella speibonae]TCC30799.1 flavodoxin [Kribbella speibonae]
MSRKVLIAYASKAGATAGIAGAIGAELTARGHDVDVVDVNRVKDLTRYDVVILGSALYMRRWRKDAVRFLRHNVDALRDRQVWLFHSGPVGPDKDQAQDMPPAVRRLAQEIGAPPAVTFAGSLEPDTAKGFLARRLATGDLAGDSRDWTKIRAWATNISTTIEPTEHGTNRRPATKPSRKHATRPPAGHFLG